MTETTQPADSPDSKPAGPQIVRTNLVDLLATLVNYSRPAIEHLEKAFQASFVADPQ